MSRAAENTIWQYWETRGDKPAFIDGLHAIAARNAGVKVNLVTPGTLGTYLPDLEPEIRDIEEPAHKADMIRTRLVMRYGGMWLDSDALVLRDLRGLFDRLESHEFVAFNDGGRLQAGRPWVRVNCFLSRPGGRIVSAWVRGQREKLPRTRFEWSEIGARMLNAICLENADRAAILPVELTTPVPWERSGDFSLADDVRASEILEKCLMVMVSNRALRQENSPLRKLTVEEIARGDHLLAKVMRAAITAARPPISGVPVTMTGL